MRGLLILTALLLALGAFNLPIGYYTFLRIVVTISSVAVVIESYKGYITPSVIVFGGLAVLFNPLIPVYLHDKALWAIIDVVAAIVFLVRGFSVPSSQKTT